MSFRVNNERRTKSDERRTTNAVQRDIICELTPTRRTRLALSMAIGLSLFVTLLWGRSAFTHRPPSHFNVLLDRRELLADGHQVATLHLNAPAKVTIMDGAHRATIDDVQPTEVRIRAGILPGRVVMRIAAPEFLVTTVELTTTLQVSDHLGDGMPDFLRLDDDHDQQSFRRWFTFLAEAQYFQAPEARPAEINDCAAFIRYAYREALRNHNGAWAANTPLPLIPALESITRYEYPHTPLGPALFRVRSGPFRASDLNDGTFAEFADVQTLQCLNTHFVTRDVSRAAPGDLLFFRQLSDHMPFHSMIFLGRSQIEKSDTRYALYHTGPTGSDPGEIRRLSIDELLHFPEPQWRPLSINPSFLGVYRWNILEREL